MAKIFSWAFRICCFSFFTAGITYALNFSDGGQPLNLTPEKIGELLVLPPQYDSVSTTKDTSPTDPFIQIDDMLFPVAMEADGVTAKSAFTGNKWTNGKVYYQFHSNVSNANKLRFRNAAEEWANVANLTFIEGTGYGNYIYVQSDSGNYSYVGMIGGAQDLGMYNWSYKYIIVHEIGHALGLSHEHSRSDRNSYVNIIWSNIEDGYENNFFLRNSTNFGPYDFLSVMHYPRDGFAIVWGTNTIEPLPAYSDFLYVMGQRNSLSEYDKSGMASRYGSPNKLSASPSSIDFGACLVNDKKELSIIIQNFGSDTVAGTASISAPFSIVSGNTYNLANGATQSVTVCYQPSAEGNYSSSISFSSGESVNVYGLGITDEDSDGDGASNYSEYIAGTSPTNPSDVLLINPTGFTTNNMAMFDISTKIGRNYQLQTSYYIQYVPWYNVGEEIVGDGSIIHLSAPMTHDNLIFRIIVTKND